MIKREIYLSKIRPFYESDLIKVLIGIRRCGKSVILKQIIEELKEKKYDDNHIIYLNFELLDYSNIKNEIDLFKYIKEKIKDKRKYYLLFDEIQNVENFEKAINSFRSDLNVSIFITGSNGRLLSGELATHLSGRYIEFRIMPFTYKEVCLLEETKNKPITENTFLDYLKWGGMPQRFAFQNESEISAYLNDLYNSIILKDVVQKSNIKDVDLLNNIIQYMLENIAQIFSATSVSNYLKNEKRNISTETLYNYISYITTSLILNKVSRYDIKGKKVLATLDKYYVSDLGIRQIKKSNININLGSSLENIVYNELIVRGYDVHVGKTINNEIDFIITKGETKKYIQVTYVLADDTVIEREFGVYKNVSDNYPKYVISMDKVNMSKEGIIHLNVIDFLLSEEF